MSESLLHDTQRHLPQRAGVGLKAEHYRTILESRPDIGFFEVHAENYMGAGGPPHRFLSAIRESYPLSLHGVGLSIGADSPLDAEHLRRLKELIARYAPGMFSEHLAWSSHDCGFLNDLLPLPYTTHSLARVVDHIDQVQEVLGRQMLLENPSTYLAFEESTYSETDFIAAIVQRTGCGLLLDVNNVYVASINQQWDPVSYIDAYPLAAVQQIHLAGHTQEADERGRPLLIDTHDRHVADIVWELFAHTIRRTGPLPTLIEWDADIPDLPTLKAEAGQADAIMRAATQPARVDVIARRPQSIVTQHQITEVQRI
ncbi:MNIO family bufferin maturase [Paraburkholderia caffeinilytica]|uniref:MNIO family bufferin maturase n=1 Tax=Paraburkholderia caffeinilytica TaxID=1761016 RepID=UPI0038BAA4A0